MIKFKYSNTFKINGNSYKKTFSITGKGIVETMYNKHSESIA